ncbi:MAG TPA: hypothetical protein VGU24_08360 [Microvirga sp.]|jgi:hypothetical protein|nr:hypothetical protein [Microvirga sp.]
MALAPTSIALEHPVVFDGVRYLHLTVHPAKPKHLRGLVAGSHPLNLGVSITARMCRVPEAVIYLLNESDAERVGRAADARLGKIVR